LTIVLIFANAFIFDVVCAISATCHVSLLNMTPFKAFPVGLLASALFLTTALAADIDVLDKQRQESPAPKSLPPRIIIDGNGNLAPDDSQKFVLGGLKVEGATVFSAESLIEPWLHLYGRETTFAQIKSIAAQMTKRYRDADYILSRVEVPVDQDALDPANAQVRLVVIEGRLDAIKFEGDEALVARVRDYWGDGEARLLAAKPLKYADVEREMLRLSDVAGIQATSRFTEGGAAGTTTLVITLKHKPFDFSINGGNTGTRSAGRGLITVSASVNSLLFIGSSTTLSYTQANHRREYAAYTIAHSHQFANGFGVNASWSQSDSPEPDSNFARIFDYETQSSTFSAGASYQAIRSRDLNLSVNLNYEQRNSDANLLNSPYTRDRLRNIHLEANFDFSDEWGGVTQIIPTLSRGVSWNSATDRDVKASAPLAPASFTRGKLHLSRNQTLPGNFSLFAVAEGQLSSAPLSSYNRYTLGGNQFGRAYDPGIVENDNGVALSLEGRWNTSFSALTLQPFVFTDWGKVWAKQGGNSEHVGSVGLGVRLFARRLPGDVPGRVNLTFFAAKATQNAGKVSAGDNRAMFQIFYSY